MSSFYILITAILLSFTVIGTGALSGLFSERSGVINVAIEGFMVIGALVYVILATFCSKYLNQTGVWVQIPLFLIAFFVTMLISLLHAFACITLKANQVISGMAINLFATGIAVFIVNVVYKGEISGMSNPIKSTQMGSDYGLSISLAITFIIIVASFFLIKKTKFGLRLKAAGENPHALESQGISVVKTRYQAVMISGALAGLAGAFFVQWHLVFKGSADGLGYISLAILIFGRWRLQWVVLAAIFFSILTGIASASLSALNISQWFSDNSNLINAAPFIISLAAIVLLSKRSKGPKAGGIPYNRSSR